MSARTVTATTVDRSLKLLRRPADLVIALLPGDRLGPGPAARVLVDRIDSTVRSSLAAVLAVLTALQKPTISHLSDEDWLAVNTVIDESSAWDVIPRLKEAKAQGIVEYPLNKVVL